ncbi:MAG: TRAM domain-containing protein [Anaerofustis stercorihominis]|nr:TRAM domain-containing protein [Anaerofustis stercorihominis]
MIDAQILSLGLSVVFGIIFGLILLLFLPRIEEAVIENVNDWAKAIKNMPLPQIITFIVALILSLVVASLIANPILKIDMSDLLKVLLVIAIYGILIYISFVISAVKYADIEGYFRNMLSRDKSQSNDMTATSRFRVSTRRNQNAPSQGQGVPKVLDTSVIIDGRILDILRTGFVDGPIIIPTFVLEELQYIADSADSIKRNRGRRGLDILNQIKALPIEVVVTQKDYDDITEVDSKLLRMATEMKGRIITNDYNLNKVAEVQGVKVLNTNDLTNAVKTVVLAGENMNVTVLKEGKEFNQGVAYLDDGTMIVIEEGRKHIGKTVEVQVTSVLQTSAGRMIFAKVINY